MYEVLTSIAIAVATIKTTATTAAASAIAKQQQNQDGPNEESDREHAIPKELNIKYILYIREERH